MVKILLREGGGGKNTQVDEGKKGHKQKKRKQSVTQSMVEKKDRTTPGRGRVPIQKKRLFHIPGEVEEEMEEAP